MQHANLKPNKPDSCLAQHLNLGEKFLRADKVGASKYNCRLPQKIRVLFISFPLRTFDLEENTWGWDVKQNN